jgi:hypothetical protein
VHRCELLATGERATMELLLVAGAAPPLFFFFNPNPPSLDLRPGEADTLSVVGFVKEPLCFCELEPAVPWRNSRITFLRFEDVFLLGNSKIHFLIFTVLPLNLF